MFTITPTNCIEWSAFLTTGHVIILLVIVLLIFGPSRLPELSRALGRSIKDFKKGMNEIKDELENADQPKQPPQVSVPPVAPVAPPVAPVVASAPPAAPPAPPAAAPAPAPAERPAAQPAQPRDDSFPTDGDPHKN